MSPEDSYTNLLSLISDFVTSIPMPYHQPEAPRQTTMELIHSVGRNAGLSMDHFIGRIHTWEGTAFITFKERNNFKSKSIYTINLKTLRPTLTSPLQKQLSGELELAFARRYS